MNFVRTLLIVAATVAFASPALRDSTIYLSPSVIRQLGKGAGGFVRLTEWPPWYYQGTPGNWLTAKVV